MRPAQRPWTGSRPTGGGRRQPKTRRRPTAAAGGTESRIGCLPIRRRPGGCEPATDEGGDGGGGRRRGFGVVAAPTARFWAVAAADSGRLVFGRADGRGRERK